MSAVAVAELRVAAGLAFPLDFVTQTAAILAQRRKGKTYTGSVIAEELVAAGIPWVALDPTGAWWGLRSSADGEHPGLPVVVIGGQHGDLPLERQAGAFVADLVLDHPGYYVLDLSLLESRPAEREFATAFGERLLRRKMQPGMDFPLHLFVDEADLFVPQEKETKSDVPLLAAFQGIVRRGGLHGLGSTLISQRPALVNKNVLTQLDILVLLRLIAGNDQDAVEKNYLRRIAPPSDVKTVMESLASLPVGEAWVFEPGATPPVFGRYRIRERQTFNSSATPKPGEQRVEPTVLADVDLDDLRERMAETIERAKEDDPVRLRRLIHDLEQQARAARVDELQAELRDLSAWASEVERASDGPHVIDELLAVYQVAKSRVGYSCDVVDEALALRDAPAVPLLSDEDREALARVERMVSTIPGAALEKLENMAREVTSALAPVAEKLAAAPEMSSPPAARPVALPRPAPRPPVPPVPAAAGSSDGTITKPKQKILDALAWWASIGVHDPKRSQVAFVAGYSHAQSRGFRDPLYGLNAEGLVAYPGDGKVSLTDRGVAVARPPAVAPSQKMLQGMILDLVGGTRAKMLAHLLSRGVPFEVSREDLAAALGYSHPQSRGFRDPLYRLHALELVEYPQPGSVRATGLCFLRR